MQALKEALTEATTATLRAELRARGLPTGGAKPALIDRLQACIELDKSFARAQQANADRPTPLHLARLLELHGNNDDVLPFALVLGGEGVVATARDQAKKRKYEEHAADGGADGGPADWNTRWEAGLHTHAVDGDERHGLRREFVDPSHEMAHAVWADGDCCDDDDLEARLAFADDVQRSADGMAAILRHRNIIELEEPVTRASTPELLARLDALQGTAADAAVQGSMAAAAVAAMVPQTGGASSRTKRRRRNRAAAAAARRVALSPQHAD
eukprot:SAG31_NODE_6741_length_1903_cov_2.453437_1_plen_271_part_00